MGLRATGSIDYVIDDRFVPENYTYEVSIMDTLNGGAVYHLGLANMSGICYTGWALGVERRLLDEMKELPKRSQDHPGHQWTRTNSNAACAQAEAKLRSARALAMEISGDNEATLDGGELLSVEQETLTRLALNNTTWSAHDVTQTGYKWARCW